MKVVNVVAFIGLSLAMAGCSASSGSYLLRRSTDQQVKSYTRIFIRRFAALPANVPEKVKDELPVRIGERLLKEGIFEGAVVQSSETFKSYSVRVDKDKRTGLVEKVVTQGQASETDLKLPGTLLMEGNIIEFNPGSRAKRYFVGFGSGKGRMTTEIRLVDPASGTELGKFEVSGEISGGLFGGGSGSALARMADETVKFFEQEVKKAK